MFRKHRLLSGWRTDAVWEVRSPWPAFIVLFLLSFVIGFNKLKLISTLDLIPNANRELGAIAISLMQTGKFADPYLFPTGPTAHLPPVYPFFVSLIYRWFGLTSTAGYVSLLFILVTYSLLIAMLPWFSDRLGLSQQAGFFGGLAGSFDLEWHGHGEYLTGIVLGLLLVAFLQRWTKDRASWRGSLFLGLGMGAAFHLQPALLLVMLGCMAFEFWWGRSKQKHTFLSVMTLGIVLSCIPWAWRNYTNFKAIFFIRSNFGLELRMGNREGAAATMAEMDEQMKKNRQMLHRHPTINSTEAEILREVGEIEYMRQAEQEALDWIRTHPGEFLRLTVGRIANLWLGPLHWPLEEPGVLALTILALWGIWQTYPSLTIPQRAALITPLATYPLVYYFIAYMPRYRVPIDWMLFMLAGAAVWNMVKRRS